jgi:hypothetical protein
MGWRMFDLIGVRLIVENWCMDSSLVRSEPDNVMLLRKGKEYRSSWVFCVTARVLDNPMWGEWDWGTDVEQLTHGCNFGCGDILVEGKAKIAISIHRQKRVGERMVAVPIGGYLQRGRHP